MSFIYSFGIFFHYQVVSYCHMQSMKIYCPTIAFINIQRHNCSYSLMVMCKPESQKPMISNRKGQDQFIYHIVDIVTKRENHCTEVKKIRPGAYSAPLTHLERSVAEIAPRLPT